MPQGSSAVRPTNGLYLSFYTWTCQVVIYIHYKNQKASSLRHYTFECSVVYSEDVVDSNFEPED